MWAHQYYDSSCTPDILTMAKPLANGVPIGALMTTNKVAEAIKIGKQRMQNCYVISNLLTFASR